MSGSYDYSALDGQLKQRYAKKITRAVPNNRFIQKNVPFSSAELIGDRFNAPILLSNDSGFTYTDPNGGLTTLNEAVAAQMKNAYLSGSEVIERTAMTYGQLARAVAPGAAFENTFDLVMKGMVEATSKRVEIAMLYGQSGVAKAASSANVSATKTTITVMSAHWAAAIWAGSEGCQLNFYRGSSEVSSGADAVFTVSAVDSVNKKITVTGTSTGITALDAEIASYPNTVDAFYNGSYGLEMVGLKKILTNTSSLFGIDAAAYSLWKGNHITTSGSLTQAKILDAVATCANLGLSEDVYVCVNPKAFNVLSSDQSALRMYDSSYSNGQGTNGFAGLKFHSPSGVVTVVPHMFVKEGDCFVINLNDMQRIGASDITFQTPGKGSAYQMFFQLPSQNGVELRMYCNQAIMLYRPAQGALLDGFSV